MRFRIAPLAVLALLAACDGLTTTPTQLESAGAVNLIGTYSSASFWTATVRSGVLPLYSKSCPGSIVVDSQSDQEWRGTFAAAAPCPAESGKVHGTVDGAGRVTMLFDGVSIADTPYAAGPCAELTLGFSGAPVLEGALSQGVLELSIETTAQCLEPPVSAELKLEARGALQP
jgi:hypothetical protein